MDRFYFNTTFDVNQKFFNIQDIINRLIDKINLLELSQNICEENKAAKCTCTVKTTEVAGMIILYAKADCPYHGKYSYLHLRNSESGQF